MFKIFLIYLGDFIDKVLKPFIYFMILTNNLMLGGLNMSLYDVIKERGYVYQCTNLNAVKNLLNSKEPTTFYLGIDPTADSLHIGHFFALMMFRYLQDAGHKGILVIGGATALIGDPSGKSDMRKMLSKEQVEHNLDEVRQLAKRFIRTDGDNPAIILNNADWFNNYDYVDFMREIGVHFNVNKMLAADAYANRLKEGGLTFLEMGYMLMQAYDFVNLNTKYGCKLQIGGSDQWGNIIAGTTLNRKNKYLSEDVDDDMNDIYGLTCPLLLTKEGKKMGKTESGTLWVARDKTTPFDFYQYFYNINDADTEMLLKLFTRVSLEEINHLCNTDIIEAKRVMAYEITKLVHGEEEADSVLEMINSLFKQKNSDINAPESDYIIESNSISVLNLFTNTGMVSSKSEIRRLIQQNGVAIDGIKCDNINYIVSKPEDKDYVLLQKGKKTFLKVHFTK